MNEAINDGLPKYNSLPKTSLPVRRKKHIFDGMDMGIFARNVKKTPTAVDGEKPPLDETKVKRGGKESKVRHVDQPFRPSAEYRNFVKDQSNANRFCAPASRHQRCAEIPTSYNNFLKRKTEYDRALGHDDSMAVTMCSDDLKVGQNSMGMICPPIETVKVHINLINRVMGKASEHTKRNEHYSAGYNKTHSFQPLVRHRPQGGLFPGFSSNSDLDGMKGNVI